MREQCIALENDAQFALGWRKARNFAAIKGDRACRWRHQTGDHLQGRGLATARRAEKRNELALFNRQIEIVDSRELAVVAGNSGKGQKAHCISLSA
ncbi:hypothetical protein D3C80_1816890 [compost metagenome]